MGFLWPFHKSFVAGFWPFFKKCTALRGFFLKQHLGVEQLVPWGRESATWVPEIFEIGQTQHTWPVLGDAYCTYFALFTRVPGHFHILFF